MSLETVKKSFVFRPKIVESLRGYSGRDFSRDLVAGLTVGIVALPLAMAFAIASGVKPEAGIFTAVIAGFLISALGGSRVAIGGPTGAFVVIVYGIVQQYGVANLIICTIMAGVILVVMGVARMGSMIKFIPYPVTMGFTSGIAVLIFSTQIKDFFGLRLEEAAPADFVEKMMVLGRHAATTHLPTLTLGVASLGLILLWPKKMARWVPGSIVALFCATAFVWAGQSGLLTMPFLADVTTIGSQFGGIPQTLPAFQWPDIEWSNIQNLIRPATTIALLAAIESLLCCVVADGMIDDRHDSNQELIAQGAANIFAPLFGGIPATGAIARTATNVKNGGRTPVAGIVHAFTLLLVILAAAPLARFIPLATLSAVLFVVAFNMGEWHMFARLRKWPKSDAAVFLTAFALTVLVDLTVAVEVGMILAAMLFIKRISETTKITAVGDAEDFETPDAVRGRQLPDGVLVFRVFGAFFFGAVDKLETALQRARQEPDVLILRMREVLAMDATGLNALEDLFERLKKHGKHLILSGPHTQPLMVMMNAGFLDRLGQENCCENIDDSIARAKQLLAAKEKRP
ncbi:MAG TPA: sulfate permease [Verrucomicrobiota bacterium]|nr:sulfate permease [Verrucomicrobiota bacterium]